jgi:BirA family transcriptional regulator, biotin operon repressor / biotin---[acetyl-CoA-carboxylase] ligase
MTPREIFTFPHQHIGRVVQMYDCVSSTNDLASANPSPGVVYVAEEQSAGRGTHGRVWESRPGESLLLSFALQPPPVLNRPVILTAWVAVSLCRAVKQLTGISPRIKWPNDLLVDGRKLSGILIESSTCVIIGMGLNLNQTPSRFAEVGLPEAISLHGITGSEWALPTVLEAVLRNLDQEYDQLLTVGLQALESTWAELSGVVGQLVQIETTEHKLIPGRLRSLSFDAVELDIGEVIPQLFRPESVRGVKRL